MAIHNVGVDVICAQELSPSCTCVYVELHLFGEMKRTTMKEDTSSPVWNERFLFELRDLDSVANLYLEAYVYNVSKTTASRKSVLGRVRLAGTCFVQLNEAVAICYPLEKRGMLFRAKGKLVLKVFLTDDPSIRDSVTLRAATSTSNEPSQQQADEFSRPCAPLIQRPGENFLFHYLQKTPQHQDFAVKHISPSLGGGNVIDGRFMRAHKNPSSHDLVERMWYLFVSVVRGRDLPDMHPMGCLNPYVEVKFGNYNARTKHFNKEQNPQWDAVFAFSNDYMQTNAVEVIVNSADEIRDDFVGLVSFDLSKVPTRVPPASALSPQWHRLVDPSGQRISGELMLSVWKGTQADEAFHDAWHSDSATPVHPSPISSQLRSKVYYAPTLWYVRLHIQRAEGLLMAGNIRLPTVHVKAKIGEQVHLTKPVATSNPSWTEEIIFVTADPLEDDLIVSVEANVRPHGKESIGHVIIPLASIDKQTDDAKIDFQWFHLEKPVGADVAPSNGSFNARVHLGLCLEGGYCVLDSYAHNSGDLRSTAKDPSCQAIGSIELGILKAEALEPRKLQEGRGVVEETTDSYCVVKYGRKWVRTRTILDSSNPRFNEQYTWEVYDPCTILTIGVFDNNQVEHNSHRMRTDCNLGKICIRISTLEAGCIYTLSYPLLVFLPTGIKKVGELHIAIRFSYTSMLSMLCKYSHPLLPTMHYTRPLPHNEDNLHRWHAVRIMATRLSLLEPPLRKEVVECICDVGSTMFSFRESKSVFNRYAAVISPLLAAWSWFEDVAKWKDPYFTVLIHFEFLVAVCNPCIILPAIPSCLFLLVLWRRRCRPSHPEHLDTSIFLVKDVHLDEIDEEFDTFPSNRPPDVVRMRYDRLRVNAGRFQTMAGDLVTVMERVETLFSWRDPRATLVFVLFCFATAIVLCITPRLAAVAVAFYTMRHPRFRSGKPTALVNFFLRLPSKRDTTIYGYGQHLPISQIPMPGRSRFDL